MKLSILIPTLPKRKEMFDKLYLHLHKQAEKYSGQVEIIYWDEVNATIGAKRNALLGWSKGRYVCFIDDDDRVADNYIDLLMEGINNDVDCCSLKGVITIDGGDPELFEHSLKYKEWKTKDAGSDIRYERGINHLNCVKSSIAKQFKYPEKNHGEDYDWSKLINGSGILQTEHYIPQILYYYNYISKK